MKSITISAKIPRELREKLTKHGVKISEIVRRALEEEVRTRENKLLMERLDVVAVKVGGKISGRDVVRAIRASREGR
jgi:hypothetical protein